MNPKNKVDELNGVMLFDHQWNAYKRYKETDEVPLFFEMGCGKSLTTLCIVGDAFKRKLIDSLLVIAPNDVHKQWATEQCQWFKDVLVLNGEQHVGMNIPYEVQCVGGRGGQKKGMWQFQNDGKLHIVCVNVDTFSQPTKWKPIAEWADRPECAIVLDEATSIKNYDSQRTQHILYAFNDVKRMRNKILSNTKVAKYRFVLTGTPTTNGPMDLWCIMEFVRPNFFHRDRYSFRYHYGMFTQLGVNTGGGVRTVHVPLTEKSWRGIKSCTDYNEAFAMFHWSPCSYTRPSSGGSEQGSFHS